MNEVLADNLCSNIKLALFQFLVEKVLISCFRSSQVNENGAYSVAVPALKNPKEVEGL